MDSCEDLEQNFEKWLTISDEEGENTNDTMEADALLTHEDGESDSENEDSNSNSSGDEMWTSDTEVRDPWVFSSQCGPSGEVFNCRTPIEFFKLYLNDDVLALIVEETNRQGRVKYADYEDTCEREIKKFIGLCLQMGVVKMPNLRDYWSSRPALGRHSIAGKVMTRKRFEQLLNSLHFADSTQYDGDRLFKIKSFVKLFNDSCEKTYHPGKEVTIDESLVPFRDRIVFRQYIPSKKHEYGIKLFKLCCKGGFTWRTKIYAGKQPSRNGPLADSIVLELMEGLLDEGRQLCTDNWYSSVPLARKLLKRKTHLIGTLRRNRKGVPTQLKGRKLKRGQIYYQQSRSGILVLKWKDKRDLLMISTKHDASLTQNNKPKVVEDYNNMMGYVDQSDQMTAYTPFVRKTTRWYLRIFFHLITQTAIVNAWRLYSDIVDKSDIVEKIRLTDFKMNIIESLLQEELQPSQTSDHKLEQLAGPKAVVRKRCVGCYKEMCQVHGRSYASSHTRRVNTRCSKCFTHFCIDCFQSLHKKCRSQ